MKSSRSNSGRLARLGQTLVVVAGATLALVGCSEDQEPGAATCSASNCPLGCCVGGECYDGRTNAACGTAAQICKVCDTGQTCSSSGACSGGSASCSHLTCRAGCCSALGCITPPTDLQCGTGGTKCEACSPDKTCTLGTCLPKQQPANCDGCRGCCHDGSDCLPGTAKTACGIGGDACQACDDGEVCDDGVCVTPPDPCDAVTCKGGCCASSGSCLPYDKQDTDGCAKDGAACEVCPGTAKACEQGTCVDKQSCASFCTAGCCDAADQCLLHSQQDNINCGDQAGACEPCAAGSSCVGGACIGGATWEIWAISASLAPKKANGDDWDNAWVSDPRPDPFFGIARSSAKWSWQYFNSATLDNTLGPQWNEKVGVWAESDLLNTTGVLLRVHDDDIGYGVNDPIGECTVVFTAADLKAGDYTTTCGDGVTSLTLKFVKASS